MKYEESDPDFDRTLEELRKDWNALRFEKKSEAELRRMMYASVLSRLTGFRVRDRKENINFLGKFLLALTVIIAFRLFSDLSTAIFAAWSLLILIDDYIGVRYLYFIKYQDTTEATLRKSLTFLKRLTLGVRLAHVFVWMSIILAVASTTTTWNTLLTAMLSLPLLVVVSWWTSKKWMDKATEVKELLNDLIDSGAQGTMAIKS
jgi:hypothetical protein